MRHHVCCGKQSVSLFCRARVLETWFLFPCCPFSSPPSAAFFPSRLPLWPAPDGCVVLSCRCSSASLLLSFFLAYLTRPALTAFARSRESHSRLCLGCFCSCREPPYRWTASELPANRHGKRVRFQSGLTPLLHLVRCLNLSCCIKQ